MINDVYIRMGNRLRRSIPFLLLLVLSGCGVVDRYIVPKSELERAQKKQQALETELKEAHEQVKYADEHVERLEIELATIKEVQNQCLAELSDLQTQKTYLKHINLQLSQKLKRLAASLDKKESIIQLHENVIRLLDDTKKTIETSLKAQIASRDAEIVTTQDKLKVVLIDKILFDSGQVDVNEQGKNLLRLIADSIRQHDDQKVVVEGHTDNVPLGPKLQRRFPSNWELSTTRASAVARFLQEEGKIPPERLSVHGYSFYHPIATNDTEEGRHQNRRIEIILSSKD